MIIQRENEIEMTIEGRITKTPAITAFIFAGLNVLVLALLAYKIESGFINASIMFWLFLMASLVFGIYSLWLANSEWLEFTNAHIVFHRQRETVSYEYNRIGTVYIQMKTAGRGLPREYLIIPINNISSFSKRKKLVKSISMYGESYRILHNGHYICTIRNHTESEVLVNYLRNKIVVLHE